MQQNGVIKGVSTLQRFTDFDNEDLQRRGIGGMRDLGLAVTPERVSWQPSDSSNRDEMGYGGGVD